MQFYVRKNCKWPKFAVEILLEQNMCVVTDNRDLEKQQKLVFVLVSLELSGCYNKDQIDWFLVELTFSCSCHPEKTCWKKYFVVT